MASRTVVRHACMLAIRCVSFSSFLFELFSRIQEKKRKEKQLPNHVSYENDATNEDYEYSVESGENKMTAKGSNRALDS